MRNLNKCSQVKVSAYILLVCPHMEYTCINCMRSIPNYLYKIVLKKSNIEREDGLHQTTADLAAYLTYCNLLHGQEYNRTSL